jgi:DNA-3-methyladenine glycosylase II
MTRPAAIPIAARAAINTLIDIDPAFATIEAQAGPLAWRVRPRGFPGLLQAIMGQQISNQAASAIWQRLAALPGATSPTGLLALDDDTLRAAGLSRPKVGHSRALATAFANGLLDAEALDAMPDDNAIAAISAVRGLGPWTAEVYLLFAHQRMDVFPAGDIAVAGALAALKGLPSRPGPVLLRTLAEPWRPYRALAARLLWHHWRFLTGRPSMDELPGSGDTQPDPVEGEAA